MDTSRHQKILARSDRCEKDKRATPRHLLSLFAVQLFLNLRTVFAKRICESMPTSRHVDMLRLRCMWRKHLIESTSTGTGPICVGGRSSYLVFQLCSYLPLLTRSLNHQLQKGEDTLNACFAPDPSLKNRSYISISYRVPFGWLSSQNRLWITLSLIACELVWFLPSAGEGRCSICE